MDSFHNKLTKLKPFFCESCHELWPTTLENCETCKTKKNKNRFNKNNQMVPNIGELPNEIKNHIENITMIEEMLTIIINIYQWILVMSNVELNLSIIMIQ